MIKRPLHRPRSAALGLVPRLVSVALLVLASLVATAGAAWAKPTVAVLGLELVDTGGIDRGLVTGAIDLTKALRDRANAGSGPYVLATDGDRMLADLKVARGCESEASACMTKIGEELKADFLLYGKVEKRTSGMQVSLKLFEVATGRMQGTATELIPTAQLNSAGLVAASKALYGRLTGAASLGTIIVTANVKEGSVLLDGVAATKLNAGSARLGSVAAGSHRVSVVATGYVTDERTVEVPGGGEIDASFALEKAAKEPDPGEGDVTPPGGGDGAGPGESTGSGPGDVAPTPAPKKKKGSTGYKVAFVGSTLVGLAAGAVWAYSYKQVGDAVDDLTAIDPAYKCKPVPEGATYGSLCDQGKSASLRTWIAAPITAAAGVLAIYTFYKGFVAERGGSSERSGSAKRKSKRPTTIVTPTVTPTGVGAAVRIDF